MIQVHLLELFAHPAIYHSVAGSILLFCGGPPVAPLFMIIFGYFIAASERSAKQLALRGLNIFCLGMLLNIALNLNLIISVKKGIFTVDLLPYIFGVDILQFAGISLLLISLLRKLLKRSLIFTLCCIVASAMAGQLLSVYIPGNTTQKYISAFFYGSANWSYFPLFPWLAYPLAGMAFFNLKHRFDLSFLKTMRMKFLLAILFVLFLVFTLRYAVSVSSDLLHYYHHGILFCAWTIIFLSFYSYFMNELNALCGESMFLKYLKWMGKHVTLVYVIQWIIIGNIATAIYKTVSSPLVLAGCFIIILLVSAGIAYLAIRVKERFMSKKRNNAAAKHER